MTRNVRPTDHEIDDIVDRLINGALANLNEGHRAEAKAKLQQLVGAIGHDERAEAVGGVCLAMQNLAHLALDEGDERHAIAIADTAISRVETRSEAKLKRIHLELLYFKGEATRLSGDLEDAIALYRQAEEQFRDFPEVIGNSTDNYPVQALVAQCMLRRATQTVNLRRFGDCIETCETLIACYSGSRIIEVERIVADAFFVVGQTYRVMKDRGSAIRWFEQAVDNYRGYDDPEIRQTIDACRSQLNWSKRPFLGRFGT